MIRHFNFEYLEESLRTAGLPAYLTAECAHFIDRNESALRRLGRDFVRFYQSEHERLDSEIRGAVTSGAYTPLFGLYEEEQQQYLASQPIIIAAPTAESNDDTPIQVKIDRDGSVGEDAYLKQT